MTTIPKLTREQAAIIGAFTGIMCGRFQDLHSYIEEKLGKPIMTHEFANKTLWLEIKEVSRKDFLGLCHAD